MQTADAKPFAVIAALLFTLTSCATRSLEHTYPVLIFPRTITTNGDPVIPTGRPSKGWIDHATSPGSDFVQMWTRDSFYARGVAMHPYFLVYDHSSNSWEQWEIWAGSQWGYYLNRSQKKRRYSDGREPEPVEAMHRQLGGVRTWSPITYVDESSSEYLLSEWSGDDARRLIEVMRRPETYPEHSTYVIWPGPNSNSYARWVLEQAGVGADLHPSMIGKDWHGPLGFGLGLTPTRTGVHLDLLTLGCAIGIKDGIELHVLGFTFGIDLWPPAIKTPFGRIGLPE
ncbi:MAG: hypothetical protein ACI89X_004854 [Planctomycetota bacterium]|jgi:hypothetical protein